MSVLIKNMEMPESCLNCPCSLNLFFCRACGGREIDRTGIKYEDGNIVVTRPSWCPLVEIKVVIDELEKAYDDLYEAKTEYESGLRDGIYAAMIRVEELPF